MKNLIAILILASSAFAEDLNSDDYTFVVPSKSVRKQLFTESEVRPLLTALRELRAQTKTIAIHLDNSPETIKWMAVINHADAILLEWDKKLP